MVTNSFHMKILAEEEALFEYKFIWYFPTSHNNIRRHGVAYSCWKPSTNIEKGFNQKI